ncbi:hypothetical protein SAV31267_013360 [Streptomyces avermitilis]|uniref:Uncharacterized protein n=1 Tax=Streptomyces avermitilis TaxID=33903 RepID=A0A4D4MIG9_STRAX|nr:hypothetical protein SAV31267_013360 [Streptomyces avermitilis]
MPASRKARIWAVAAARYAVSTWPRTGSAWAQESRKRTELPPPRVRRAVADFLASATEANGSPLFSSSFVSPETL